VRGYGSAKDSTISYSGILEISFIVLVLTLEKREPGPGRKVLAYLLRLWLERGAAVHDRVRISSHDGDKVGG
jgi:hypothetical protein